MASIVTKGFVEGIPLSDKPLADVKQSQPLSTNSDKEMLFLPYLVQLEIKYKTREGKRVSLFHWMNVTQVACASRTDKACRAEDIGKAAVLAPTIAKRMFLTSAEMQEIQRTAKIEAAQDAIPYFNIGMKAEPTPMGDIPITIDAVQVIPLSMHL